MPQARKAIEQALRLDPKNPEFHGTLGLIDLVYVWDYPAAKRELSASGPQTSAFHLLSCSAHLLHETGESREAEDLVLRMAADEPGSTAVLNELGCVDYYKGDYASAVARYQEALRVDPQSPLPYWGLGKSLTQQGRYTESIVALQSFHARNGIQPPILTSEMGYAFARARRTADARRIIDDMARQRKQIFVDPFLTAVVYLGLGDRNACFHWLQEAESQRSPFLISILTDPKWSEVANDPRFIATVNRMDLAKKSN
jgi:tetratricopeptide (TPR) repeat protein